MSIKLRGLIMLLALALVAGACGDDDGDTGYPEEVKAQYMADCTAALNVEFCECTLDGLEKEYTADELVEVMASSDEAPAEFEAITLACFDQLELEE